MDIRMYGRNEAGWSIMGQALPVELQEFLEKL